MPTARRGKTTAHIGKHLVVAGKIPIQQGGKTVPDSVPCPFSSCHAKENFHDDGCYTRVFVCYTDSRVERYEITIPRVECNSCGHSHALLAPVIIPYSLFSFHFVISLLYDYMIVSQKAEKIW